MNGRRAKALHRAAERLANEPTGYRAIDRSYLISAAAAVRAGLRKRIGKGKPYKVVRYQLVCTGVRRLYQDLKKAYYRGIVK